MHNEKKKRQHFVWQKYLKKWSENEKIICLMDERIFDVGLMKIGQEKYFYKLKELSEQEISFLKALIEKDNRPIIKELNHGWVNFFNKIFKIKNNLSTKGISHPEIDRMLDVQICNIEEDLHCSIESEGGKILDLLYNKDLSFYDDDDKLITFLFYICQQYLRTQKMSSNVRSSLGSFNGFNIDAMWSVLRHISATNVGLSLYQDREKFRPIIIENKSDLPFVTGDQPVINTYAIGLQLDKEPEDLEFYYPLTPTIALLLTSKEQYHKESIILATELEVIKYNNWIYEQSSKQVYSSSRSALERLLNDKRE